MKRELQLAKNMLILSLGTVLPKLTTLVTLPILTACLTKTEYGIYDLITTLVSLVLPLATLKAEAAAFRFLIDQRKDKKAAKTVVSTITFFILPVSLIVVTVLFYIFATRLNIFTAALVALYFFLDTLFSMTRQVLRGLSKNMIYSMTTVINAVVNMILIIFAVWYLDKGLTGLMIALNISMAIAQLVVLFAGNLFSYISIKSFSKECLKKIIDYSWPMVPNSLSGWVMRLSDRLVLSAFLGVEATAVYAVANKFPQLLSLVQGTFTYAWQENASISVNDEDSSGYYSKIFDVMLRLLTGCMAVLIGICPVLFAVLIRGDYNEAYPQMSILFAAMLFNCLSSFMGGIYVAHMKTKSVGITTVVAAAANIIIDLSLVNVIGIYAASLSTLVSYIILFVYRVYDVQKFQKLFFSIRQMAVYFGVIFGMCIFCLMNVFSLNVLNTVIGAVFGIFINRSLLKNMITQLKLRRTENRKH